MGTRGDLGAHGHLQDPLLGGTGNRSPPPRSVAHNPNLTLGIQLIGAEHDALIVIQAPLQHLQAPDVGTGDRGMGQRPN